MTEVIKCEIIDGVGIVSINRPHRHNAITDDAFDGLSRAIREYIRNREVRCILLRGEGPSFCSGATPINSVDVSMVRTTSASSSITSACAWRHLTRPNLSSRRCKATPSAAVSRSPFPLISESSLTMPCLGYPRWRLVLYQTREERRSCLRWSVPPARSC
jgi:hypothetical protein